LYAEPSHVKEQSPTPSLRAKRSNPSSLIINGLIRNIAFAVTFSPFFRQLFLFAQHILMKNISENCQSQKKKAQISQT
jgi:hypothetical protein